MRAKERKRARLREIVGMISGARTLAVLSLHGLPAAMLAAIRARVREKVRIAIARTTLLRKALQSIGAQQIVPYVAKECALAASDVGPFELYDLLCSMEIEMYAKPGQLAPNDIVVPAGETALTPGPVLSELKSIGLDARVVGGKIAIAKDCVVAKAGTKITKTLAAVLRKLDIKPIHLRARVHAALAEGIVFSEEILHIDKAKFAQDVASVAREARQIALEIAWPVSETIAQLILRAHFGAHKIAIEGAIPLPEVIEQIIKKAHAQVLNISAKIGG